MSKVSGMPLYAFTVHTMGVDGLERSGAITACYFQESESGTYTLFKDESHSVVEAFKTDLVTRIVRTEKPLV